jgi:peptidoglycan-associated lipoprotein
MNKLNAVLILVLAAMVAGCGASKAYVDQAVSESESRSSAQYTGLRDATDGNAEEISKLRGLAAELADKTDMAINKATGFEDYQIIWEGLVNFDYDSYDITATAESILMEGGEKMERNPRSLMEIVGHTDHSGSAKYNLMLGEKRADATKRFLVDHFGISLYRLFAVSHGEQKPLAMPDESQASSRNRRVQLKLWGTL